MDLAEAAFRTIAVLHTVAGYVFFAFATNEDFQRVCFYRNTNPLAGDIKKYLVQIGCWTMIGCGILAFKIPSAAVVLAWTYG